MNRLALRFLLLFILQCIYGGCALFSSSQVKPKDEPQHVKPESIQGCYELTLSAWRPNLKLQRDAEFITPPRRIQLFAEQGKEGWEANGYIVKAAPGVKPSIHRGSYWLPKSSRSIKIVWTTGFSGLSMVLTVDGRDLRGTAESFWDFTREPQTADVIARRVECQPTPTPAEPVRANCQGDDAQAIIFAHEGWGPVRIGAVYKAVEAFLGEGRAGNRYSDVHFEDYEEKGLQVSFDNADNSVHAIYFYNGQRDHPQFAAFCGQVDKGINWRSSIEDVKKAFGTPVRQFSGNNFDGTWTRLLFDGIDFRFENERMVRIGVPGN